MATKNKKHSTLAGEVSGAYVDRLVNHFKAVITLQKQLVQAGTKKSSKDLVMECTRKVNGLTQTSKIEVGKYMTRLKELQPRLINDTKHQIRNAFKHPGGGRSYSLVNGESKAALLSLVPMNMKNGANACFIQVADDGYVARRDAIGDIIWTSYYSGLQTVNLDKANVKGGVFNAADGTLAAVLDYARRRGAERGIDVNSLISRDRIPAPGALILKTQHVASLISLFAESFGSGEAALNPQVASIKARADAAAQMQKISYQQLRSAFQAAQPPKPKVPRVSKDGTKTKRSTKVADKVAHAEEVINKFVMRK